MPSVLGCSSSKYEACAISMGSNEAPSKISVKTIYKQSKGFSISWLKASRKWASDILGWCWDVWQQWKTILQLMFGYLSLTGQGRHVLSPSMEEKTIVGLCRLNRNPFFSRCPFSATYSSPCWAAVVMRATISPCSTASCSERTNTSLSSSSRLSISLMTRWRSSTSRRRRRAASNSILELGVTSLDEGAVAAAEVGSEPACPAGTLRKSPMEMDLRWEEEGRRMLEEEAEGRTFVVEGTEDSCSPSLSEFSSSCWCFFMFAHGCCSCFLSRCEALVLFCLCCLFRRGRESSSTVLLPVRRSIH